MLFDASLLNTQYNKVRIKGKWSDSKRVVGPFQHLGVVVI